MPVTPYLFFDGRCEEALNFYKKALGAKVEMMMRYKESPEPPPPGMVAPGSENKIMHSCFRINGADVMASDGCAQGKPKFEGFSLSVNAKDEAEADRMFKALAEGGEVRHAARQDVLRQALRHGRRPLRRRLDGDRGAVASGKHVWGTSVRATASFDRMKVAQAEAARKVRVAIDLALLWQIFERHRIPESVFR